MAEFLRAVTRLFDLSKTETSNDGEIERLLGVISRSGALTAIECQQILKEADSTTRLEKMFQMLALQDEIHNADFLRHLRTVGIRTMISDEKQQPEVDESVVEQLMDCLSQNSKIDHRGKFPLISSNFCFQRHEQELLYESVERLFNSTLLGETKRSDNILWLAGGAGLGTTALATQLVHDSSFLMDKCRVVQVIWLDMQQLSPSSSATATSMNAIVSEMMRLLLSPNQVQALLNDELEPDSPASILVTQSLLAKIKEHFMQCVQILPGQGVLLVVDSVTNCQSLMQIIGGLSPTVRCLAILNRKVESVVEAAIETDKATIVVSKIPDSDLIEHFLAKNVPRTDAERLAKSCDGSPLIASLIQSKLTMDASPSSFDHLLPAGKLTPETLAIQLLDSTLIGNTFWRSFLLFEPGEAVDIGDLMLIWKCSRIEAEKYCRDFCKKCLIRPLVDGESFMASSTMAALDETRFSYKFFSVHSKVFDATLRLAALRQQLTFNSQNLTEMRFAIIHHAFIAENGNIESTFHEAVRLGRQKLVEKIISIVESVDYLWKFSDCQLIVLNLADYFYQNAYGFILEEQNPNNEQPVFNSGWLRLFSRFLSTLSKDERRAAAIGKAAAAICQRSSVATAFIRQTFVHAASFNGIELISLFLQNSPMKTHRNSFLTSKEPRLGRTALIMAASKGHVALTRLLVNAGVNTLITRDAASKLALTVALEQGHVDVAKILYDETLFQYHQHEHHRHQNNSPKLEVAATITAEEMLVPLISAALSGQESVVEFVLARGGFHINALDDHKRTALMASVWANSISVARKIIDAGANVNASDEFGKSALSRAVENGNLAMVELLLQRGADVNRRDKNGRSAILIAVGTRNYYAADDAITRLLLEHGANLKTVDKHGRTALQIAAWNNRIGAVDLMIRHCPATINHKDSHGASALIAAAERGNNRIVELLIKSGACVDSRDENGQTALIKASEAGHLKTCQVLLDKGAAINAVDLRRVTSLLIAAENGETCVVRLLLEKYGADASIADKQQMTVLHAAVENSYFDITKMLLQSQSADGQITDARDVQGQNALMMCSYRGDVLLTNLLLSTNRVDPNTASNDGLTPLMMAVKNNHLALSQLLVEKGAGIENRCKTGINSLLFSASFGHPIVARYLLEQGANPNARDDRGFTASMIAAKNGFLGVVKLLLEYNADITLCDDNNRTALMRAAANGHFSIVQLLIRVLRSNDGDPSRLLSMLDATDKHGKTSLVKAAENGHVGTVKLLLENGARDGVASAILLAAANGHVEVVQVLFDSGKDADIMQATGVDALFEAIRNDQEAVVHLLTVVRGVNANASNSDGNSALLLAVCEGHAEIARILIEHSAQVNAPGEHGLTCLMAASKEGHTSIVRLLLRSGADVNAFDEHRNTALMIAAKNKHGKIAKLLLDAGAAADLKNEWGETALITATRTEDVALVRHLLERGASINAADQHGYSALLIAVWKSNFTLVRLLLDAGADIHAKDNDGYNGLMIAARNKQVDIATLLLDRGVDVNDQNAHGYTALMIATLKGDTPFAKMLLTAGADPKITDLNGHTAVESALKKSQSDIAYLFQSFQQHQEQ